MNFKLALNKLFRELSGDGFIETSDPQIVHDNFHTNRKAHTAFLKPEEEKIDTLNKAFKELKAWIDPERMDDLHIVAAYGDNGNVDISSYYADPNDPENFSKNTYINLPKEKVDAVLTAYEDMTTDVITGGYNIVIKGGSSEIATEWHQDANIGPDEDDDNLLVGIFGFENTPHTTRFKGLLGDIEAPVDHICFIDGNETHKTPETPRPTIQIYALD